jgi:hypothetical protein
MDFPGGAQTVRIVFDSSKFVPSGWVMRRSECRLECSVSMVSTSVDTSPVLLRGVMGVMGVMGDSTSVTAQFAQLVLSSEDSWSSKLSKDWGER